MKSRNILIKVSRYGLRPGEWRHDCWLLAASSIGGEEQYPSSIGLPHHSNLTMPTKPSRGRSITLMIGPLYCSSLPLLTPFPLLLYPLCSVITRSWANPHLPTSNQPSKKLLRLSKEFNIASHSNFETVSLKSPRHCCIQKIYITYNLNKNLKK